ncbi:hypothetical protein P4T04_05005 [Bacillus badius]|uniref:hypothetical protein n=1 Tax=Bacillus badius TaxID=1455 RepID=UPI002E1F382C|nr:hypothetical protein [Bacillus badius]
MNDYQIVIKQWTNPILATEGVNTFIQDCNDNDVEILDITSHVTEIEDFMTYVFIFKINDGNETHIGKKKKWDDERW